MCLSPCSDPHQDPQAAEEQAGVQEGAHPEDPRRGEPAGSTTADAAARQHDVVLRRAGEARGQEGSSAGHGQQGRGGPHAHLHHGVAEHGGL